MERQKTIITTSILGIVVNIILVIFKATIGIIVNSIAITLDALNNLTDVVSSVVTIIGTKLANKKPDKKHPFGHGRIEYVTSSIVSFIILLAGATAFKESVLKIITPGETKYSIISIIIIAVGVFVKFFLGRHIIKIGKKVNSYSLIASGEDAFMDSVLSFSTFVGAIVNLVWNLNLEGFLGVIISLIILKSAIEILKETIDSMIGTRADKELTDQLKKKLCSYKEVQGAYDLALHNYGPSKSIATAHIQVRDNMTAQEIHKLTRKITIDLYNKFGIITTIGIYAANETGHYKEMRDEVSKIIEKFEDIKQLHGFYVDEDNKEVYFDIILDFECENPEQIKQKIIKELKQKYSDYRFNIILDDDITD